MTSITSTHSITRLAPSPTGALHLGNALTFLVNWALACQHGWMVRMRIENLDGPRVRPGTAEQALTVLEWLGVDWQPPVLYQRNDLQPYHDALMALYEQAMIYPSTHTRREVEASLSAPQRGEHEVIFPEHLRPGEHERPPHCPPPRLSDQWQDQSQANQDHVNTAWRVLVTDEPIQFNDERLGGQQVNLQATIGDFIIANRMGLPAYQLAVVVDDARQGITDVVRGEDLLDSTARQLHLYRLLDLTPPKRWWHLPLVIGEDGRRLAKRHGDTRLSTYRDQQQVTCERIVGLLAYWAGVTSSPVEMDAATFAQRFDLGKLPKDSIVFTREHQAWLLSK